MLKSQRFSEGETFMSQFILEYWAFGGTSVVIASAIRRKLRFKQRLAAAWGKSWVRIGAGQTVSPVYESFLLL